VSKFHYAANGIGFTKRSITLENLKSMRSFKYLSPPSHVLICSFFIRLVVILNIVLV